MLPVTTAFRFTVVVSIVTESEVTAFAVLTPTVRKPSVVAKANEMNRMEFEYLRLWDKASPFLNLNLLSMVAGGRIHK